MAIKRMDNILIVVDDLEAVKAFFLDLGLELEGETTVEGPSFAVNSTFAGEVQHAYGPVIAREPAVPGEMR